MKKIARRVVAGLGALAIAGMTVAMAGYSSASPLDSVGGKLECTYQSSPGSLAISGSCGSSSALGTNGGSLAGQIDRSDKSAAGEMSLNTTLGSLRGEFSGGITSGGTLVGEFTPAGSVGIPFVAIPG